MSKHRKRWTPKGKSEIVAYYQERGIGKASTEYAVSVTTIYKWEAILNLVEFFMMYLFWVWHVSLIIFIPWRAFVLFTLTGYTKFQLF